MIGWLSRMLHFPHAPKLPNPPAPRDYRDEHSEELRKRADRVLADLRAVRSIDIIVRRR